MEKKLSETWKSVKKMTGTHNRKVRKEYLSIMTMRPHSVQTMKPSKSIAAVAPFNNETTSSMDIVDDLQIPDSQIPDLVDSMDTRNGSHSDGICALFLRIHILCKCA